MADGEAGGCDAVTVMVETTVALDTATNVLEAEAVGGGTTALCNQTSVKTPTGLVSTAVQSALPHVDKTTHVLVAVGTEALEGVTNGVLAADCAPETASVAVPVPYNRKPIHQNAHLTNICASTNTHTHTHTHTASNSCSSL